MRSIANIVALAMLAQLPQQSPPTGYRYPEASDRVAAWGVEIKGGDAPFYASADFAGDGLLDTAWILLSETGTGWAVVATASSQQARGWLRLAQGKESPQSIGLATVPPGAHETLCGKRTRTCAPGEQTVLQLRHAALSVFQFEGSASYFWWDETRGSFVQTWISN